MKAHPSQDEEWLLDRPFWRAHPYRGRLGLPSVDWRTAIDLELGILFHRIPKSASSSLTASIIATLRGDAQLALRQSQRRSLRRQLVNPSALSEEEVEHVPDLFKFVFVRNPYVRVLSAYLSKVVSVRRGKPQSPCSETSARPPNWRNGKPPTFADFCRYLAEGGLCCKHPWAPQVDFLVLPKSDYDFIGRVERINTDFRAIVVRLGRDQSGAMVQPEDLRHATGAEKMMGNYYTPELFSLVHRIYEADFETFGYARKYPHSAEASSYGKFGLGLN